MKFKCMHSKLLPTITNYLHILMENKDVTPIWTLMGGQ